MGRTADIVVVGGGIMGVMTALHLKEAGAGRLWLLEKKHLAAGSSGKSGAILRQHYSHPKTVAMAREGLQYYARVQQRYGPSIGFQRRGMLLLVDPRDRDVLVDLVQMQQGLGVPTRVMEEDDLARFEPRAQFEPDALGCHETDSGTVDARRTVEVLADVAMDRGVLISMGETVLALRRQGDRVTGVETSHGGIDAGHVVLAAGPWCTQLLPAAGIDWPLRVVRPQQAFLQSPTGFGPTPPVVGDLRLGAYMRPEAAGLLRLGSLSYGHDDTVEDPDHYDEGVAMEFLRHARDNISRRLPALAQATLWGGGAALYTVTPDSHAIVDAPAPGLTVATGFSGHGFKLAPAIARGITEWILQGEPSAFPREFFSPQRFEAPRPATAGYRFGIMG